VGSGGCSGSTSDVSKVDSSVVVSVQGVVVGSLGHASCGEARVAGCEAADVESLGGEGLQRTSDDSAVLSGDDGLAVHLGSLHNLLIDGLCVLNHSRLDDIAFQNGLDLFDHSLLDDFVDNGCVYNLAAQSGVDFAAGGNIVFGDGRGSLDHDVAALSGELSLLNEGGLDLSLVHHLSHLLHIELLSFSVDDGLNLLLLYGVDSLVDNDLLEWFQ